MYSSKKRSYSSSLKVIGWSFLGIIILYIVISVGKLIAGNFYEMSATEIFFLIGFSVFLTVIFFKMQNVSQHDYEKLNPYSSSLDKPIDKLHEERFKKIKFFKYKNGKFIHIGYRWFNPPGTVNTCPKEWKKSIMKINGFEDFPKPENNN